MIPRKMNFCLASSIMALALTVAVQSANAQVPVTVYYPSQPVVTYSPVRAGVFGQRIVYRPTVSYATSVAYAPVTTYYAPTVSYYAPTVATPVTTYYYAPATVVARPVTTYYAPTYYYAPAPVTTYYSSWVGY